jgi:glycosyltransferase involved in cell wall biosynthesis
MKKNLFLITSLFPFGSAETFLETEIKTLSNSFNEIIIMPINSFGKKREVPSNCSIFTFINGKKNIFNFLKVFYLIISNREIFIEFINLWTKTNGFKKSKIFVASAINSIGIKKQIELYIKNQSTKDFIFYSYWCDDSAIALALLKEEKKIKFAIARAHRWDVYFEENPYDYLPMRTYLLTHLDQIFPISENGKRYIDTFWKGDKKTTLSRLGVKNQDTFKSKNHSDDTIFMVSCSTTKPVKRINLIIDSLKEITEFKVNWVHFGDGSELEELKKEAFLKLPENISIEWKGNRSNHEILEYYTIENPDIFINVSSSEGIPVSIMEAYSFGIPCIATDVGGTCEIVNNENGILLSPNPNFSEIKYAIFTFAKMNESTFYSFRRNARNTQLKKFSSENNYKEFYDKITKYIDQSNPGSE